MRSSAAWASPPWRPRCRSADKFNPEKGIWPFFGMLADLLALWCALFMEPVFRTYEHPEEPDEEA